MKDATELLFKPVFFSEPLFRNQADLAQQLLSHPQSAYYNNSDKDSPDYQKDLNKIKTYISQLLSVTVNRSISSAFESSLELIISDRLLLTETDGEQVTAQIIKALREKNSGSTIPASKLLAREELTESFAKARYISIVNHRPLEIDLTFTFNDNTFSFQRLFLEDVASAVKGEIDCLKFYRFNFPMEEYALTFWAALKYFLTEEIKSNWNKRGLVDTLSKSFRLNPSLLEPLKYSESISVTEVRHIVDDLLIKLNEARQLQVLINSAAIYSTSIIAMDPNESRLAKIYFVFYDSDNDISFKRLSKEDYHYWRLFYWEKLKSIHDIKNFTYTEYLSANTI
ncbi:MAG: hypothetical protein EOO16_11505 [Chitinophagaceae bacterium]|nr:MAG: hypothetical protein EOO16_11505 [Chitinophagaceae bacterium]